MGEYALSVGERGKERLEILNQVYNSSSIALLKEAGLKKGMRVLDLGCGIGLLSSEISKVVSSSGSVVALDNSQEQIEVARKIAQLNEIENIEFVCTSAQDLSIFDKQFDVIYCRYLLSHLQNPKEVLDEAIRVLKCGGKLIFEEIGGAGDCICYPPHEGYSAWLKGVEKQFQYQKSDFEFGFKVPHLLSSMGCTIEKTSLKQPLLTTKKEKKLLRLGLEECQDKFVEAGFFTEEEVSKLREQLFDFEENNSLVACYSRTVQTIATKKGENHANKF